MAKLIEQELKPQPNLSYKLSLIGALGLCGGSSARDTLKRVKRGSANVEELIIANLAASRSQVAMSVKDLRQAGSQPRQVVKLAAKLGLLASTNPLRQSVFKAALRDAELDPLMHALYAAYRSKEPIDQLTLPRLSKQPSSSLAELEDRALLLMAAARPGSTLGRAELEDILRKKWSKRVHEIASLALGRLLTLDMGGEPELEFLDLPMFLAGLRVPGEDLVEAVLLKGPGGARDEAYRRRWWGAAIRLVDSGHLAELAGKLMLQSREERREGVRALCRRLLVKNSWKKLDEGLRTLLREGIAEAPDPAASDPFLHVLAVLARGTSALPEDESKVLGERRSYAFGLFLDGRLGAGGSDPGEVLWDHLTRDDWVRPRGGAGSFEAEFLDQLNTLVHDLFLAGSREPGSGLRPKEAYRPKGLREHRPELMSVLGRYLELYPLFRVK
ncbi:MAG: hypothetical protein ACE5F1_18505 [Planctomycetota bacterium]